MVVGGEDTLATSTSEILDLNTLGLSSGNLIMHTGNMLFLKGRGLLSGDLFLDQSELPLS